MIERVLRVGSLALLTTLAAGGCADSGSQVASIHAPDGAAIYQRYCASCHGTSGDGQGPAAYLLFPKPRNFERGEYKLRSTPQGELPTEEDLIRTINEGIPGTAMFAFGNLLSATEVRATVGHVKSLTPAFATAEATAVDRLLEIPPVPPLTAELIAAGKQTYASFRCAQCHGPEGRGDGPSAPTLRDSQGHPFPAADFTYGIYKSGGRPEDLYRTFLTGMAGTPMPSFDSAFETEEQAWGLVYYILSLSARRPSPPTRSDPGPVVAYELAEAAALQDPWSEAWKSIHPHRVVLRPLWYRNDYPPVVRVRAGWFDQRLALLLEWEDDKRDADALRTEDFADAAALQFALSERPPFVGMGMSSPDGQVEIWYWRADRQADSEGERSIERVTTYPNMVVDRYPFAGSASAANDASRGVLPPSNQAAPFVPGRDLGNPLSTGELMRKPVHSLGAGGFGTLTASPADRMRASGRGEWRDGSYRAVFNASLRPARPGFEADFSAGAVPMAVAIWDGAAGDRNGTKLVSQWVTLRLGDESTNRSREQRR